MLAPLRIASLLSSATEILYALGLDDQVVGVSHECDYPPDARGKPCLTRSHIDAEQTSLGIDQQVKGVAAAGGSLYTMDEQLLDALAPDLIVTQAQCDVCAIKFDEVMRLVRSRVALRETHVVALSPNSLDDVFDDILRLGQATSQFAAAQRYLHQLRQRVDTVSRATADLTLAQRPRVVCVEWIEPLMIAANWTPQLVEYAGGQNGLSQSGRHSEYSSWSDVIAYDPEVLILMPCGFDLPRTLREVAVLPEYDRWRDLSAVRNGRVFAIDGNAYLNRSGPRLVDSLEILAHLIHPSRFGPPAGISEASQAWSVFSG